MFLFAGLAIAGVVGLAAAFYFSIRSGSGGTKRLRSARAGRAGTESPGSRSGGTARPDNARRAANGSRPANTGPAANAPSRNYRGEASTGPDPVLDFADPALVGGRRGGPGASAGDSHASDPRLVAAVPDESRPVGWSAEGPPREAHEVEDAGTTAGPRRRVGFRKGADVDEELWPAESFGGVSDEQFWDDMASDKPLATTARTAHQDPRTRNRPFDTVPPPTATKLTATKLTATKPTATQPVQRMTPQVPGVTQPVRLAAGTSSLLSAPSQPMSAPSQPVSAPSQPMSPAPPAETRGRRRARRSDDEDPLTSAAFSLRSSGPVDGRSSRRSPDMPREQYDAAVTQETQTFSAAETEAASSGYPGGVPPFRQSERRQTGTRSHARHGGTGEAGRTARQAYPQDGYQGTGSNPASSYQGSGSYQTGGYPTGGYPTGGYPDGGYQGNGHQTGARHGAHQALARRSPGAHQAGANAYGSNGHRAPYDPREDYRRLTHLG